MVAPQVGFPPYFVQFITFYCAMSLFMVGKLLGGWRRACARATHLTPHSSFAPTQICSESIGSLAAIVTPNATYAVLVLTFVLLVGSGNGGNHRWG